MLYRPVCRHSTRGASFDPLRQVVTLLRTRVRWGKSGRRYRPVWPSSRLSSPTEDLWYSRGLWCKPGHIWGVVQWGKMGKIWHSNWRLDAWMLGRLQSWAAYSVGLGESTIDAVYGRDVVYTCCCMGERRLPSLCDLEWLSVRLSCL